MNIHGMLMTIHGMSINIHAVSMNIHGMFTKNPWSVHEYPLIVHDYPWDVHRLLFMNTPSSSTESSWVLFMDIPMDVHRLSIDLHNSPMPWKKLEKLETKKRFKLRFQKGVGVTWAPQMCSMSPLLYLALTYRNPSVCPQKLRGLLDTPCTSAVRGSACNTLHSATTLALKPLSPAATTRPASRLPT